VGQVTRVDNIGAEIIMISDNEHAIPVQVNRNGIRSIAVGTADIHRLNLPFLTAESDVKPDDLLVSSGLDGIFPAGYPVARITKVERDPAETFAVVEAKPLAQLDRSREVMLLWFEASSEPPASASRNQDTPNTATPPAATRPAVENSAPPPAPEAAPDRND
jgi:rod shape-determining protein MreC